MDMSLSSHLTNIIGPIMLAINVTLLLRDIAVGYYRSRLVDKLCVAIVDDKRNDRDWEWRLQTYRAVSRTVMMFKFWQPLDSFYSDESFITVGATDPSAD